MTIPSEQMERELFEAWAKTRYSTRPRRVGPHYLPEDINEAWEGWSAARSLVPQQEGWRPIETAPKDGTKFVAFCPRLGIAAPAHWNEDKYAKKPRPFFDHWGSRIWGLHWVRDDQPTHWKPLDEPPAPLAAAPVVKDET